ncbi:hypothetical protein AcW1_003559 [Taiwanofungus camphoratus]|nr:hypothetical protein AcW1_003559 [Antrodia cinnamomea]
MALEAEDEDLIFVEWFKLHLRPDHLDSEEVNKSNIPQLPAGKTVIEVFGDFLAYLFSCAHRYITETHANGDLLWHSVANHIEIVLSHPNGWEGIQQTRMRRAAILGGLVPDTSAGYSRIHFVTEGEASLHFCLRNGLVSDSIKDGESVLIVDAGGGTIDLSTYTFAQVSPLSVEEIVSPDCIMQGSTRVNARAYTFLHDRLRKSAYGNDEDVKTMLDYFEKSTKPIFKDANEPCYIKFGSMSCNDPAVKIRRGQLILSGAEVASFFAPSIAKIVDAIQKQVQEAFTPVTMTFLVGGFASSPWLFSQLQLSLEPLGLCISRPDRHTNKAVAEGAISFYLDSFVSVRVARITYGCECMVLYGGTNPEHFVRRESIVTRPSGRRVLPDAFTVILPKVSLTSSPFPHMIISPWLQGTRMHDDEEVAHSFFKEASQKSALNKISSEITCYRGTSKDPHWTDIEAEMFSHSFYSLCGHFARGQKKTTWLEGRVLFLGL